MLMFAKTNVLVLAPHADDEVLGCGAAVHRMVREGANVTVAVFGQRTFAKPEGGTCIDPSRLQREVRAAGTQLGVQDTRVFMFRDCYFHEDLYQVIKTCESLRDELRPDLVLVPSAADTHQDHRTMAQAAAVAWRPHLLSLYGGAEVWAYRAPSSYGFVATHYVKVLEGDVSAKIRAMHEYPSELQLAPGSRSPGHLFNDTAYHGGLSGTLFAEPFAYVGGVL